MRFLIAGSSGFIGSNLVQHLRGCGHQVVPLVRREPAPDEVRWDPGTGRLDPAVLDEVDVVVNLAGAPLVGNPHSRTWARELRRSRVEGTGLLARAIASRRRPPVFLVGTGISFYGDHGAEPVTEESHSQGDALLTDVVREWEQAADPAREAGARVCFLRTAPVLDRRSSPLRQLRVLFKAGLGTRLGSGEQHFPVVSLPDWLAAAAFLAESQDLHGPFNLTCPRTPTNAEFTASLAAAVGRPSFLVAPAPVLRAAAGRLAPEVLGSVNARPDALTRAGFDFHDEDVDAVLATGLSGSR